MLRILVSLAAVVALVAGLIIARAETSGVDEEELAVFTEELNQQTTTSGDQVTETTTDENAPPNLGTRPELDIDGWLQSDPTSVEDTNGEVRIIHFWAASCHNCHATFPFLVELDNRFGDEGLTTIGVHAAEFEFEKNPDVVQSSATEYDLTWPIALDPEKENFRAWRPENRGWPMTFVLDQNGDVRFERKGEGAYDRLAETVEYLIENGP